MRHYPVFIDLTGRIVSVSGARETAIPKLRLLLKTNAKIEVYDENVSEYVRDMEQDSRLSVFERRFEEEDARRSTLIYAANDDPAENRRVAGIGTATGTLVNIVDDLEGSDFITPAIVDRSPVTVAIGTEGTAPVLARGIKSKIESLLPESVGELARIGGLFRSEAAKLPSGRSRRDFWSRFFFRDGPRAFEEEGPEGATRVLAALAASASEHAQESGSVVFASTGFGNPGLLSHRTRSLLHNADSVVFDKGVSASVLELARREAEFREYSRFDSVPKDSNGPEIEFMASKAASGELVVRLFSAFEERRGDLRSEVELVAARGIKCEVIQNGAMSACWPPANARSRPIDHRSESAMPFGQRFGAAFQAQARIRAIEKFRRSGPFAPSPALDDAENEIRR